MEMEAKKNLQLCRISSLASVFTSTAGYLWLSCDFSPKSKFPVDNDFDSALSVHSRISRDDNVRRRQNKRKRRALRRSLSFELHDDNDERDLDMRHRTLFMPSSYTYFVRSVFFSFGYFVCKFSRRKRKKIHKFRHP